MSRSRASATDGACASACSAARSIRRMQGHRHIIELARRRLRLDQVWLLVSPGNPLKPRRGMAPFDRRLASARGIADGRRVIASAIEAVFGTRYTIDTLRRLLRPIPARALRLADGRGHPGAVAALASLAGVRAPRSIRRAAAARLQSSGLVRPRGASASRSARRPARSAAVLAEHAAPAWIFLHVPQHAASATAIRASRRSRAIAKPPKPFSPARHRAAPRKKVAKPTLPVAGKTPGTPRKKTIAAGPRPVAARRSRKAEPSALERLQSVIVGSLEDDKAENVVTLDLAGKAAFCDRMVIATGLADRQIAAMAEHLSEKLHAGGLEARAGGGRRRRRLGADRCRRHHRAPVQAGGAGDVRAGEDVGRGTGRGGSRLIGATGQTGSTCATRRVAAASAASTERSCISVLADSHRGGADAGRRVFLRPASGRTGRASVRRPLRQGASGRNRCRRTARIARGRRRPPAG